MYFWNKTLHVSDSSSVHHQEFFSLHTQQWYTSYSLRAESGRSSVLILLASCQQTCMIYTIAVCTVKKLLTMHGHLKVKLLQVFEPVNDTTI